MARIASRDKRQGSRQPDHQSRTTSKKRDSSNGKAIESRSAVISAIQQAFLTFLKEHRVGSADDIRSLVELPTGVHPSVVGVAFRLLMQDRLIKIARVGVSNRPVAHGRIARFWKLTALGRGTK